MSNGGRPSARVAGGRIDQLEAQALDLRAARDSAGDQLAAAYAVIAGLRDALPDPELQGLKAQMADLARLADDLGWKQTAGVLAAAADGMPDDPEPEEPEDAEEPLVPSPA